MIGKVTLASSTHFGRTCSQSNSKILGNQADPIEEETMDSISSMLRKEIEGKVVIPSHLIRLLIKNLRTP